MSALTEPSSVAIHSLTTGTSRWTTGVTSTSGTSGGGGSRRRQPVAATRIPAATSDARFTVAPSGSPPRPIAALGRALEIPRLLRTRLPPRGGFRSISPHICRVRRSKQRVGERCLDDDAASQAASVTEKSQPAVTISATLSLNPGDRVGAFEVLSPIGAGGMGEVYRARDTRLGREVAIKILPEAFAHDAERLARFSREARVLASLNHSGLAALYGIEEFGGGRAGLVMELVPGRTLADRLAGGPLAPKEALEVCRQVAEALEAAHAKGVIHRDLKPANIKVTPQGRVKVLDVGLAKALLGDRSEPDSEESPTVTRATRDGVGLGTPGYTSPEQARGQEQDKRTDIWSFGCVLYETLTGRRAFSGRTASDTLVAVLSEEPDWAALPSTIPAGVRTLLQRCLRKDAEHRLHDIADARIELAEGALGAPTLATARGLAPTPLPRRRFLLAAGAILLAIAGFLGYLGLGVRPSSSLAESSLAVLPFHLAEEPESKGDMGLGFADDITTYLANLEGLKVRPTRSVVSFRGLDLDVQEAGRTLKVDNVLSGTVRRTEAGYRVGVQLVRVADGSSYWGETFDVETSALPTLAKRITDRVSGALGVRTAARGTSTEGRHTANAAAYEAYLRGRAYLVHSTSEGTTAAAAAFEEALALDPAYALAHAGLAMASAEMHLRYAPAGEVEAWGEAARAQAQRALTLDPNLAEVHQALAAVYGKTDFEWDKTIEESRRALQLNPRLDLPYSYLARAYYHLGLLKLADQNVHAALALSPENRTEPIRAQAVVALLDGRFVQAVPLLEEVQRISGKPLSDPYLALAYYYSGQAARGEALLEALSRDPSASGAARARSTLAAFLAARGERSRAADIAQDVATGKYMDHHVANSLGAAYAQLGQPEQAVRWLRKAVETGFPCPPWWGRDPLLAPLHRHAAFEAFLQEVQPLLREAEGRYSGH